MYHTARTRWQLRLVNASFVVLFLVAVGLLQWASREFHWRFDLTQNRLNSLSPASVAALEALPEPVTVTAFVGERAETRAIIRAFVAQYQEHKRDLALEFVNPDTDPVRTREAGVRDPAGELVLSYGGTSENIPLGRLSEENMTSALTRLGHRGERWLVFLAGHGERSPQGQANFDLSTWAGQLAKRGFHTRPLTLAEDATVPDNTTALVIAGPRTRLLEGEVKAIEAYVEKGGNLLWLMDPGPLHGLEPLAERLGIEQHPGVIVDPASQVLAGNPLALIATQYGAHPTVRDFTQVTLFPETAGLAVDPPEGWTSQVLLDTRPGAWAETGALSGEVQFDKGEDIDGPLTFGVALTRELDGGEEQRVVVIGDGDFLSNSIVANGGNLELGMSIANWLSRDEAYVNIPVRTARDRGLELSPAAQATLGAAFLFLLPLGLLAGGAAVWWRRRRR